MHKYTSKNNFEYIKINTDSAHDTVSSLAHGDMFTVEGGCYEKYGDWFSRLDCEQHPVEVIDTQMEVYHEGTAWVPRECCTIPHKRNAHTSDMFKVKFEKTGMVASNSKTYHCWSSAGEKTTSKGLAKRTNSFFKDVYIQVSAD